MSARLLILLTLLLSGLACDSNPEGFTDHSFTMDLGGVETRVRLSAPSGARDRLPAILLISDAGAVDLDHSLRDVEGRILSQNYRDIAEHLSRNGWVVMRHDKRHVSGPDALNADLVRSLKTSELLDDARAMLSTMRRDHLVDRKRMFVYGYGAGAVLAAQLATEEPELAGLILQGPIVNGYARGLREQVSRVALPFLREHAVEGKMDSGSLKAAFNANTGPVVRSWLELFATANNGAPRPTKEFDLNRDGLLDLESEVLPIVRRVLADDSAIMDRFDLPPLIEVAAKLKLPVLILQGDQDATALLTGAQELDALLDTREHQDHELVRYQWLGHSLGEAHSRAEDMFAPIAPSPLTDMLNWLDDHA